LFTDFYQLTMLQAYWREDWNKTAEFSLFARRLPECRNYLLACGLEDCLTYLEELHFSEPALEYLRSLGHFSDDFLDWLKDYSFSGDVFAMPEGTAIFGGEPVLEITAPLAEAQLVETCLINRINAQTLAASKCSRVLTAAQGRAVVDFGLRRMHGTEAAVKAARAFYIAGVASTSNVMAGSAYGIPVSGTMAHSYIQAHEDEAQAFRRFAELYPETTLLVDTYNTLEGVRNVVRMAQELGPDFRVRAIRLDSGDLADLSIRARDILDAAGLEKVRIFASGNLDEYSISRLRRSGARIDGFGVGTLMGISADSPSLDFCYKLTSYDGKDQCKFSTGKETLPGAKQVFRVEEDGKYVRDILAGREESHPGRPLLVKVMENGKRIDTDAADMVAARERAREDLARLPESLLGLEQVEHPYPVEISESLSARLERLREKRGK